MKDQITQQVIDAITRIAELDPGKVSLETSFEDLGLDSLDALTLVAELEDQFSVSISDEEAYAFTTVQDAVESLQQRLVGKSEAPETTAEQEL